jgi:hypothetical protein
MGVDIHPYRSGLEHHIRQVVLVVVDAAAAGRLNHRSV